MDSRLCRGKNKNCYPLALENEQDVLFCVIFTMNNLPVGCFFFLNFKDKCS